MKEENLDKLVKETLGGFQPQPSNRVWSGIEAALDHQLAPPKSSKRLFAYVSVAVVAVLVSIGILYLRSCNTSSSPKILSSLPVLINKHNSAPDITSSNLVNTSTTSQSINLTNRINVKTHVTTNKAAKSKGKLTSNINSSGANYVFSSLDVTETTISESLKETSQLFFENSINLASQTSDNALIPQIESLDKAESLSDKPEDDNVMSAVDSPILPENQDSVLSQVEPKLPTNSANNDLPPMVPNSPNAVKGIRFANCWSIDVFAGPSYLSSNKKSVFLIESPKVSSYANESGIVKANFGMNARYHVNNWFVNTGVSLASYGENLNIALNVDVNDTTGYLSYNTKLQINYDTIGYFDDPLFPGISYPILSLNSYIDTIGSKWNTIDTSYLKSINLSSFNRAHYIDVPLMLGYQFVYNKFVFELSTGVSLAINISKNGSIISNNISTDFSKSINPYRPVIVNYQLAAGIGYQLTKQFAVMFRPNYRTNLNSVLQPGYGIDTRYHAIGINLGINYKIK